MMEEKTRTARHESLAHKKSGKGVLAQAIYSMCVPGRVGRTRDSTEGRTRRANEQGGNAHRRISSLPIPCNSTVNYEASKTSQTPSEKER